MCFSAFSSPKTRFSRAHHSQLLLQIFIGGSFSPAICRLASLTGGRPGVNPLATAKRCEAGWLNIISAFSAFSAVKISLPGTKEKGPVV
jgi:hypothetical protein